MDAASNLKGDDFKDLITKMFRYAVYGEEPEFTDVLQRVIFDMEKPAIDANNQKWELRKLDYEAKRTNEIIRIAEEQKSKNHNYVGNIKDFNNENPIF